MVKSIDHEDAGPSTNTATIRFSEELLEQIDAWVDDQRDPSLGRLEAIRRLVVLGLLNAVPSRAARSETSSESSQLASDQLDRMSDKSATAEDQRTRKRRLLSGPSEFRDVRKDRNMK